jgi:RNA polymerase sigma-70 factor (ECF subfamily)
LLLRLVRTDPDVSEPNPTEGSLDVAILYAEHAQFLWKSLFRMGVPEADLPDAVQEVLLVVHRRLDYFDARSKMTTWLFGICLRVAATLRRTRRRRREQPLDPYDQASELTEHNHPEQHAIELDAHRRLEFGLGALDPEKRAVFVMFEIEGLGCSQIAELLGVPKGTVFSRLSHARREFLQRLERLEKREAKAQATGGPR